MEEHFETFDEQGNPTGLVPRSRVHREGLWHRAAHVFLFRPDGRLLIQRRQSTKDVWPGAWDLSVGEHLQPGESFEQGALRGLREELNVHDVVLEPLGDLVRGRLDVAELGIKDYELQRSFRCTCDRRVTPNSSEVAEVALVTLHALACAFAERPTDFTPWFRHTAHELELLVGT